MRDHILTTGFAVAVFSVFVQGLTMTPLLRRVGEIPESRGCAPRMPHGWYEAGQISLAQLSVGPVKR